MEINFENIVVRREPPPVKYSSNYLGKSIKDLENSTFVLRIGYPKELLNTRIDNLEFESNELYFSFDSLKQKESSPFYYGALGKL